MLVFLGEKPVNQRMEPTRPPPRHAAWPPWWPRN